MKAPVQTSHSQRTRSQLPNGLPLTHGRLPNGLEIWIVERHSAPVFTYQTWFKVGSKDEKLDSRLNVTGLAHLFEHLMFRGTATVEDGEFDEILTRNGVNDENATTWLDRTNYYQSLPSEKLELIMRLEADRMSNLVLDQDVLDTERDAVLGEYRMGLDDPDTVSYDHLYETAFTKHPYRYTTIGTEKEIQGFRLEDLQYFYKTYYAPNNASLLIVGDVQPDQVFELAEKYYGHLQPQSVPHRQAPAEPAQNAERWVEFEHPQLIETKLVLGYRVPGITHPDQAALCVADSFLNAGEGAFLRSLWVNSGLAATVSGNLNQLQDPGLFLLSADVSDGHEPRELLDRLDQALRREQLLAPGKISFDQQVLRAKNQFILETYQQWEENGCLANFMGEFLASAGNPLAGFELLSAVQGVQPEDVLRVLEKYWDPSLRTVVVGRPKKGTEGVAQ